MKQTAMLTVFILSAVAMLGLGRPLAFAQSSARVLLASGAAVPGHPGFTFGPFYDLGMNGQDQIVFRTTLQSPRIAFAAIARSTGVTFSVVAFQGLLSPVARQTYESFSAPSINNAGAVTFTATLKGSVAEGAPTAAVVRMDGNNSQLVAAEGDPAPGSPGEVFKEFSAPLIGSTGEVLFAARTTGPAPGSGLFLWTPQGIKPVALPNAFHLGAQDLLQPIFFSHDQAVWIRRGAPLEAANEQFFRAVAIRDFQQLNPPPDAANQSQILPAQPSQKPVQMLMVLLEGDHAETVEIQGNPSQPVVAVHSSGTDGVPPFSFTAIRGQTSGPGGGSMIFAGAPVRQEDDFGLFCFCDGQVTRLSRPEDFTLLAHGLNGRPIVSLTGDGQHTVAFIAPIGAQAGADAIVVSDVP